MTFVGVEEVVLAGWDRGQEVAVLAVDRLFWFWVCHQIGQRLPGGDVGALRIAGQASLPLTAMCRLRTGRQWLVLGYADEEQTRPGLRRPEVRGVEHFGAAVVSGVVDLPQQPLEGWAAGLVVVGECAGVLQHEPPGACVAQDPGVCLQQGGVRV